MSARCRIRMKGRSNTSNLVVLSMLSAVLGSGCASYGEPECGSEIYGGGTFWVSLADGLEGRLEGVGFRREDLAYTDEAGLQTTWRRTGETGGMVQVSGESAFFVGSVSLGSEAIEGCEDAVLLTVSASADSVHIDLSAERDSGGLRGLLEGSAQSAVSSKSPGTLKHEVGPLQLHVDKAWTGCIPTDQVEVSVGWQMDSDVRRDDREPCPLIEL